MAAKLPQELPWQDADNKWAALLNPIISNPIVNGVQLKGIPLAIGINVINHKLARVPQGYIITRMKNGFSQIYETSSQMPALTIQLNSSAAIEVDIYVY